jgi:hypothetical protein
MKVFPVYMNSLMRTAPLVGSTELSTDDCAHQRLVVMAMGVEDTQLLLYPRLIPLVRGGRFTEGQGLTLTRLEMVLNGTQWSSAELGRTRWNSVELGGTQ